MSDNYFERLSALARKLDTGIQKLENAWEYPRIFVGGCADVSAETEAAIEALKSSIKSTEDGVDELIRLKETSDSGVETFLKEGQAMYDILKKDVDNLETVFEEYGYRFDTDNVDNSSGLKKTEMASNSNVSAEDDSMEEIIFTPDLSWRCKKKSVDKASLNGNEHLSQKSAILHTMPMSTLDKATNTPNCNIQLKSKILNQNSGQYSATHKPFLTSLMERPREPIYSKHFYSALKKDFH